MNEYEDEPHADDAPQLVRSYKYRCYPTAEQAKRLNAWQIACWHVQRECIHQREVAWEQQATRTEPQPNWASQGRMITQARHEFAYLADVPGGTMNLIVKRVDQAYQKVWQERKKGIAAQPRHARKHNEMGLPFRGVERGTRIVAQQGRFAHWMLADASKLGPLKVRMSRPIPAGAEIRQAHLTRAADGWYISFACLIPIPDPLPPAAKALNGVDLGCIHEGDQQRIAVVDDGRIYRATDNLKRTHKRLTTKQRLVDPKRKVKGKAKAADPKSKRTQQRRQEIARLHQRTARQRAHQAQYIARRLVDTADVTAFEDVNWKALRAKGGTRKRGLNRSMATAAPGRMIALTQEKAEVAGRQVVKVRAAYTSQECSACGARPEQKKGLTVRVWTCGICGTEHDRDVNAARNVVKRAMNL